MERGQPGQLNGYRMYRHKRTYTDMNKHPHTDSNRHKDIEICTTGSYTHMSTYKCTHGHTLIYKHMRT